MNKTQQVEIIQQCIELIFGVAVAQFITPGGGSEGLDRAYELSDICDRLTEQLAKLKA